MTPTNAVFRQSHTCVCHLVTLALVVAVSAIAMPALAGDPLNPSDGAVPPSASKKVAAAPGFNRLAQQKVAARKLTKASILASLENQKAILSLEPVTSKAYPKMKLALANFYWDLSQWYDREAHSNALEQKIFDAEEANNTVEVKRLKASRADLLVKMRTHQSFTADTYDKVIAGFPNLKNLDEIRYYLGQHLALMKRTKRSVEVYKGLIRNHPSSKYIPDALVNLGEFWFAQNDFTNALKMYEAATSVRYKASPVYNYAIYKQAWCNYNLGRYSVGLARLETVVENTRALVASKGATGAIDLQKEAQNDMVLAYAKAGKPGAISYFKKWAPGRHLVLGARLAMLYSDETEYERSNHLLAQLIKEARRTRGQGHLALTFQRQLVDNAHILGDKAKLIQQVKVLSGLLESLRRKGVPKKFLRTEAANIDAMIRTMAFGFHQEFRTTRHRKTLDYAQVLYAEYLRLFPGKAESDAVRFNACILMQMAGKLAQAAVCLGEVIESKSGGAHAAEAAERLVIVLLEMYKKKSTKIRTSVVGSRKGNAKTGTPQKRSVSKEGRRFLNAVDLWFKVLDTKRKAGTLSNQDNANIPKALFLAALTYYDHNHFEEAAKRFRQFADEFADHPWATEAVEYVLSAYNLVRDVPSLKRYADRLKADKRYYRGAVKVTVDAIAQEVEFLECFKPEKADRHREAARCFLNYERNHPGSSKAPDALHNAALNAFQANQVEGAIKIQQTLYAKFGGKHRLGTLALYNIAEIFRETTVYSEAATIYETFVNSHPKHALAKQALQYASVFREALGEHDRAVKNLELYLSNYGSGNKEAARIDMNIVLIRSKQGRPKQVIRYAKRHLKRYGKGEPVAVRLRVLGALGTAFKAESKRKDAAETFKRTVKFYRNLSETEAASLDMRSVAAVAEASFNLGTTALRAAKRIKIEGNGKRIEKLTSRKLRAMDRTKKLFNEVIQYNHPGWAIAGFFSLGDAYENLAEAIENSPVPRELRRHTPEVLEEYKTAVAEQCGKIRAVRAIPAYKNGLRIARRQKWFNVWSQKAEQALARLDFRDTAIKEYRLRPGAVRANGATPMFYK